MSVCLLFWALSRSHSTNVAKRSQLQNLHTHTKNAVCSILPEFCVQKSGYFSTLIDKYWVKQKHSAHVMAILRTQRTATNEREKMFKSKKFLFSPSPSLSLNIVKASELVSREMFVFRMWNKTRMGMKWNKKNKQTLSNSWLRWTASDLFLCKKPTKPVKSIRSEKMPTKMRTEKE